MQALEGYTIPLKLQQGLVVMSMSKPNKADMDNYPHVFLTSDMNWDPSILDDDYPESEWDFPTPEDIDTRINNYGELIHRSSSMAFWESCHFDNPYAAPSQLHVFATSVHKQNPDFEAIRPYLGWIPLARVKTTLDNTTQFANNYITIDKGSSPYSTKVKIAPSRVPLALVASTILAIAAGALDAFVADFHTRRAAGDIDVL